ncbi:hypothetical protein [Sporosarcina koreensis]|uniref:hypothetical protein n=1 Tax=Sporosarcina koreensis TaxID=334735 RepID=UPI00075F553B|nr:hypothetical protein [Sporosarcina koreensis]
MISIKNLKLIEDLKEEHESLKNELESLKEVKSEKLHEVAVNMLRRIQRYLENHSLTVTEKNTEFEDGFVANYKKGYLRGEVSLYDHSIKIFYEGKTIEILCVAPKPSVTIYLQSLDVEEDILSAQINHLDSEIRKLKDEIKSYNRENFAFTSKMDNGTKTLQNEDDVLAHLFK